MTHEIDLDELEMLRKQYPEAAKVGKKPAKGSTAARYTLLKHKKSQNEAINAVGNVLSFKDNIASVVYTISVTCAGQAAKDTEGVPDYAKLEAMQVAVTDFLNEQYKEHTL